MENTLSSIIILTYNGLPFTKECISSIFQYTQSSYELIFIDNGSTDGTVDFLSSIPNARIIKNAQNKGFSGGCNQGISLANGENIVLLNNDTVVTKDWLDQLLYWLNSDRSIGIVGPKSNFISEQQRIMPVPYQTMKEMKEFAADWGKQHNKQGYEADQLSGLCMLFKRTLTDMIGGFDEQFFPGFFEDTDFSIRAQILGKKLWVANDVFIHHYGSSSFKTDRRSHYNYIQESRKKFFAKWKINDLRQIKEIAQREKPFNRYQHFIPFK